MLQLIIYDQLHTKYLHASCSEYLFLHTTAKPRSPYGPLTLNNFSQQLALDCSKNFIEELQKAGKKANRISCETYEKGLLSYCLSHTIKDIYIMVPSEPSLYTTLQKLAENIKQYDIRIVFLANTQFLLSHEEFLTHYKKPPVMEIFYRRMRKKFSILMDGEHPAGGKRNYDAENRKFDKTFSQPGEEMQYPTTRYQALALLDTFVHHKLDYFGTLEDAMYEHNDTVYHLLLSTSINFGLLTPLEVIQAVEQSDTSLNNKEGFIRQILGWREYMYHRFWYYKDIIYSENKLNHTKKLPSRFRWPEQSPLQMYCVNHVLKTVKNTGYSHHITRLMIIGNFSLLMGYNPHDVNKWFREMYADAFERVVTPNVLGMSQFADGGNLATKPYISSANYISGMSNYCKHCFYDPKVKVGEKACPMNYLYWNFVDKHRELFKRQPYIVSNIDKLDIAVIRKQAAAFIASIV